MIPAPRWDRVKRLFEGAVALAGPEREAFLAEACSGDDALRREVESLLAAHEEAGGFLTDTGQGLEDAAPVGPGRRLGPYCVVGLIGRGGMGEVYRAVRDDDHFKKVVALKLVRGEAATGALARRFRAERQILAGLEHAGIARLLDGGAADDGRPFLVMEHVEGTRIDAYCQERRLPPRARVELFRAVCAAVQYAHQCLVVHRDLKPANILVTAEGVPKLLDFGVAKLIDPAAAGEATATLFGAMTPAYASPEQVRGEAITTATDVYSLGVILYELLTGRRPYRLAGDSPLELQRAVCDQEPERPGVAEDLDAVVLKALRKPPDRRYPTVEAFSEDLRRYLEGLPVTARKGTARYLAAKFVRRHRAKVALGALLLALAGGFAVSRAVQARRIAQEKDKAERIAAFLVGLFRVSDPSESRGNSITAREVLDTGAARIQAELQDQPEVRAALMNTMGTVYDNLGLYSQAAPLIEQALEARRRVLGGDHPDVAASLHTLGGVLHSKGDYAGAEARYREALAMRRRLLGSDHADVAKTLNNLAIVMADRGNQREAETLYREALALHRQRLGEEHVEVARTLNNLATVMRNQGDYDEAERLHRQSLAMKRRLLGNDHVSVASSLVNLATVLQEKGDPGAEGFQREALGLQRRLHRGEHPGVARAMDNLANAIVERRPADAEAEALSREALAMRRRIFGAEHPEVARSLHNLGSVLARRGDRRAAELLVREALAMRRALLGDDHTDVAIAARDLAELLAEQGKAADAEPLAREALEIERRAWPAAHPEVATAQSVLGACLAAARRFEEAEPLLRASHQVLHTRFGPQSPWTRAAAERLTLLRQAPPRPPYTASSPAK